MLRSRLQAGTAALVALGLSLAAPSASAETLNEALADAYNNNPTLQAARAQLRQVDEQVPQALSNWRPTVDVEGTIGSEWQSDNLKAFGTSSATREPKAATLNLTQPIYRGGRTVAQRDQAENLVSAGRAQLTSVEQQVLLQAVTAYVDVLRDLRVLDLTKSNEQVIDEQLKQTRERFNVGEVTKTDVSQAEARLAGAVADRIQAQGNLTSSRAIYRQVIGAAPGKLDVPDLPGGLPTGEEEAIALSENAPVVSAAVFVERAARDGTDVVFGELLPTISLIGQVGGDEDVTRPNQRSATAGIFAQVVIPLYQAGGVESRVRESKQLTAQRRQELDEARRQAIQDATTAWQALETAHAQIESFTAQVSSNKVALDGVRQEQQVGLRTVLDVLNAQQEVLNSQVSLVVARRDSIVAAYQTLAAVGTLTAADLKLPVELYDPEKHYREVRNKWWGLNASGQ
ncbi:MAG TPA: TolC family outer membrane protein [Candidatus Acidoferrum sp.]|nr:TolC family outer membrane protein [Candidatus Acidoferrum sp.]